MKNQNKTSKTVQFFLDRGLRCFGSLGSVVCFEFFAAGFGAGTSVCAFRFNKHYFDTILCQSYFPTHYFSPKLC